MNGAILRNKSGFSHGTARDLLHDLLRPGCSYPTSEQRSEETKHSKRKDTERREGTRCKESPRAVT